MQAHICNNADHLEIDIFLDKLVKYTIYKFLSLRILEWLDNKHDGILFVQVDPNNSSAGHF